MADDSKFFYYKESDNKIGPLSFAEIKEKVESGELGERVLIHQKGRGDWIAYKQYVKIKTKRDDGRTGDPPGFHIVRATLNAGLGCFAVGMIFTICNAGMFFIILGIFFLIFFLALGHVLKACSLEAAQRNDDLLRTIRNSIMKNDLN